MSREKNIIYAARFVSMLFTPFYLPLIGLILLFTFSYLALLPIGYRLQILALVYLFTILLPTYIIHFYRRHQGWNLIELGHRERRMVPYAISIVCYLSCMWVLKWFNVFHFVSSILMASLMVQVVCAVINVWWKVSTHSAAIGGGGCLDFVCRDFRVQPSVVVLRGARSGRPPGLGKNDSSTALACSGRSRFLRRLYLCFPRNSVSVI